MKNNFGRLITVVVLTMLILGLAMLLAGCGPEEEEEVIPTPVSVKPTATPVPSTVKGPVPPTATPMPAAPPPAETKEAIGLIDDFEGSDFDDRWWSYTDEGTASFTCTPDQPGHASAHAMRLTFEVGAGGYVNCGTDVEPSRWGDASGLSFSWRADRSGLTMIVILDMEDPTQTNPEVEGLTPFQAELQAPGEEWTPITLTWDAFAKVEWVGEGGADVLDPTHVVGLYFEVIGKQSGSVWVDDLQLMTGLAAATPAPTASTPPPSTAVEPEITPLPEGAPLAGTSTLERDFALPIPLFAPDSAWNQTTTSAAVLPESDQQILVTYRVLRGDITSLHGYEEPATTWPFVDISLDEYAIPVFRAGAGQQSVLLCNYEGNREWPHPKFDIAQEGGPVIVPAPAGMVRPAGPEDTGADGHLVLYNSETFEEYDFWQATTVRNAECESLGGGQKGTAILEAGVVDFFDVRGPGANPDTYYSARAHGTPLLAGLILPEDVESGAIAHALSLAIPGPRNTSADPSEPLASDYFYPASTTETDFFNTNPQALAAGQRIRLTHTLVDEEGQVIDESQLAPITRMFLTALRTYGAYLVDNAAGFSFSAEDIHTAVLHLSDDEVNTLIGQPPGTPLPAGMTRWQVVIEKLTEELELIPIAYGPWEEGQDPATATIEIANFEVVEPAVP
jgi:hypothetical protein